MFFKPGLGNALGTTSSGGGGVDEDVDSEYQYNVNGRLHSIVTALGTRVFSYDVNGYLISVTGSGIYKSKTFTYTDGKLTFKDVL